MPFYSGKSGSVSIAATVYPLSEWSMEVASEALDTTNFGSTGYQTNEAGITSATITASGPYSGSSPAVIGASAAFILKYDSVASGFTVTARITNISVSTSARGVGQINITATSNGSFSVSP